VRAQIAGLGTVARIHVGTVRVTGAHPLAARSTASRLLVALLCTLDDAVAATCWDACTSCVLILTSAILAARSRARRIDGEWIARSAAAIEAFGRAVACIAVVCALSIARALGITHRHVGVLAAVQVFAVREAVLVVVDAISAQRIVALRAADCDRCIPRTAPIVAVREAVLIVVDSIAAGRIGVFRTLLERVRRSRVRRASVGRSSVWCPGVVRTGVSRACVLRCAVERRVRVRSAGRVRCAAQQCGDEGEGEKCSSETECQRAKRVCGTCVLFSRARMHGVPPGGGFWNTTAMTQAQCQN